MAHPEIAAAPSHSDVHPAFTNHPCKPLLTVSSSSLQQPNSSSSSSSNRAPLLSAAASFCDAFARKAPLDTILAHFSSSPAVFALEHGLRTYFGLLAECLSYEDMRFSGFFADVDQGKVSVRGEARFMWTSTGQGWDEVFTYVLQFDEERKVKVYEVWADSGAAYLASKGELKP